LGFMGSHAVVRNRNECRSTSTEEHARTECPAPCLRSRNKRGTDAPRRALRVASAWQRLLEFHLRWRRRDRPHGADKGRASQITYALTAVPESVHNVTCYLF